ncbi:probable disease resistance protein At4g27220 [Punica granatum]|uniref:Probable disease resistance protein At4g27220 n=1 Tax=Punica granatum TaxID=22663 RepID=A0A6P8DJN3_PUNGR|nr:probable disease resistance protein At4g27220 [Punica granatum]
MAGEFLSGLASIVFEYSIALIARNVGYALLSESYVKDLQAGVSKMNDASQELQHDIDEALMTEGHSIHAKVHRWFLTAEERKREAEELIERKKNAASRYGWVTNPKTRYLLGRKAKYALQDIKDHLAEKTFERISYRPSQPEGMVTASSTQGIVSLQTRESMLKDIMKALADDTVNRIGVYGVPGIGKTTLLSQVATQAKASKEYVEVVSALGNPEPKRIRPWIKNAIEKATMIAQGENRDNKKDNEGKVKEQAPQKKETTLQKLKQATQKQKQAQEEKKETGRIKNAIEKATMIAQRENRDKKKDNEGKDKEQAPQKQEKTLQKLKQATQKQKQAQEEKKETAVLVLVDDLSYKLDLEDIGIGDTDKDNIKVKLVMTSTSCPLLADEMHCHPVFHLNYLKNDEALKLFENTVGAKLSDPGLQGIANEPVNNSRGLPHLIVAITHELQKNKSTEYWKDALERLKKSDSVKSYLDLNFRHLDKTQEKLLSIISGVDAGEGISDEALLRYGVGLGLFTGSTHTMEAARGQMRVSLDGLRTTSLLLDSGDTRVKVIDVVREAARDQHTLVLQDEKDLQELDVKLCERKMIFLPYPDIQELPRIGECPELEILVLFAQEDRLLPVPDLFSVSIPKLKVLHFSHTCLKPLSSLIRYLKNLQTLCLENCDLEDVRIVRELKKLQVFSLMGSKITRLPREVGELTGLRSLDLSHCSSLEVIEPGSLEGLVQLEELYLEDSFVQWHLERDEQRSNAGISELNKMSRLSNLDILIPDVDMLCEDLPFLGKLDRYRVLIGDE